MSEERKILRPLPPFPPIRYRYQTSELGFFAEIYLPKRVAYQKVLYETLTAGLRFYEIKGEKHFGDPCKLPKILRFLRDYGELRRRSPEMSLEEQLRSIDRCFFGYSMYEVDGVFWSEEKQSAIEERTQVIRLMFVPRDFKQKVEKLLLKGYKVSYPQVRTYARIYLNADEDIEDEIRKAAEEVKESPEKGWHDEIVQYVDKWINDAGILVFGYILFEICEEIGATLEPEEEIWVTSFWNLHVNKVIKENPRCYILHSMGLDD